MTKPDLAYSAEAGVYQDAEAQIPAVRDGDPVRALVDEASGVPAVLAAPATLRIEGDGVPSVQFGGGKR